MRRSQLFAGAASMLMAMGLFAGAPSSVADTRQERVVSHDAFEVVKTGKDANGRVYRVVELFTPSESSGFSVGEGSFSTSERGVERAELRTLPAPTGKPILNLTITSFADEVRVESPRETLRTSKASGALVADGGRTLVLRGLQPGESTQIEFDSTGSQGEQITRSLPLRTLEANTAAAALATAFQYANAVQYQTFISPQYVGMDLMTNVGCTEGYAMGGRWRQPRLSSTASVKSRVGHRPAVPDNAVRSRQLGQSRWLPDDCFQEGFRHSALQRIEKPDFYANG